MADIDYNKYLYNANNKKDKKYEIKPNEKSAREVFSMWILNNYYIKMILRMFIASLILPIIFIFFVIQIIFSSTEDTLSSGIVLLIILGVIFLILFLIYAVLIIVFSIKILNITQSLKQLGDTSFDACRSFVIAGFICFLLTLLFGITSIFSIILFAIALNNSKQILRKLVHDYSFDDLYPLDFSFKNINNKTKVLLNGIAMKFLGSEGTL